MDNDIKHQLGCDCELFTMEDLCADDTTKSIKETEKDLTKLYFGFKREKVDLEKVSTYIVVLLLILLTHS